MATSLLHNLLCRSATSPTHWPFEEMLVRGGEAGTRCAHVENLENLVERILGVFQGVMASQLQKRWSEVALRWATSCSSRLYASKSFQVCLSVCLSVYTSLCLSVCLYIFVSVCLSVCLSVCTFLCLSVCLSVCLFVHLSVCLSTEFACMFVSQSICVHFVFCVQPHLVSHTMTIYGKL